MNFSNDDAYNYNVEEINYQYLYKNILKGISVKYLITSILVCHLTKESEINIFSFYNISIAPLISSQDIIFRESIEDCFNKYPKPHIHTINDKYKRLLQKTSSIDVSYYVFIPVLYNNRRYLFIGFLPKKTKEIPEELYDDLKQIFVSYDMLFKSENLEKNYNLLQNYVKEVGHDIASAVQATLAKLSNISRGIISGPMADKKIIEAQDEIMGAFRIAESLGFTVDPDYNIRHGDYFNIINCAQYVINHYKSEAEEGHKKIVLNFRSNKIKIWGDRKGIESAIGQYLFNAIKYSYGSTKIYIDIYTNRDNVFFKIQDKGILLDEDEFDKIWDFGYRGENAKDKHVNGAGIGLYTVKKIITAHGGQVKVETRRVKKIVIFSFSISKDIFSKTRLL